MLFSNFSLITLTLIDVVFNSELEKETVTLFLKVLFSALINQSVEITPPKGSASFIDIKSRTSRVAFQSNSLTGKEVVKPLFFLKLYNQVLSLLPVENAPVSVEKVNGPPKIDCLSGSGLGLVKLTPEQDDKEKTKTTIDKKRIMISLK